MATYNGINSFMYKIDKWPNIFKNLALFTIYLKYVWLFFKIMFELVKKSIMQRR